MVLDPASGAVEPYCDRPVLERFKGVNDLVFASNGDLYFTDQGQTGLQDPSGRIYRRRAGGELELLLDAIPSPNGLVFNRDETSLFIAVTRASCVWQAGMLLNQQFSKVGVFVFLQGGTGPDGMAMDVNGNLSVCHAGLGVAWLFSVLGEPLARIQSCTGVMTTNLAYGGPDNKTVYITETETGTILKADLQVPGQPMYSHMA
jgi:gluconolactonase